MLSLLKKVKIAILSGALAFTLSSTYAQNSYAGEVAEIRGANCNAEWQDGDDLSPPPCGNGNNIGVNEYEVTIRWEPAVAVLGDIAAPAQTFKMGVDDHKKIETILGETLSTIYFYSERQADQVCFTYGFLGIAPLPLSKASSIIKTDDNPAGYSSTVRDNCMMLPKPLITIKAPEWSDFVSDSCLEFKTESSNYKPGGVNKSVVGVVVECIEDTMMNIFNGDTVSGETSGETSIFNTLQDRVVTAIRGLLALYVIFFGYQFIVEKRGTKQNEWYWFALKAVLVMYFAAGPGMTQLLPELQRFSKGMSLVVMEAGMGNEVDKTDANIRLTTAKEQYDYTYEELMTARIALAKIQQDLAKDPDNATLLSELKYAENVREQALDAYNLAIATYNDARGDVTSFGYKYCDFRDIVREDPNAYIKDGVNNEFMKLWDMIDCKVAKYLGYGYTDSYNVPYTLVVGVSSVLSAFFLLPLTLVFLVFIILLIIRIVHIYIVASLALIILVYISPLLIPSVLFKFTRGIFDKWLTQVIAYTVQPIIMFAFVAFMFAAFDSVMFGGNHEFVPMTTSHSFDENRMCVTVSENETERRLCSSGDFANYDLSGSDSSKIICDDPNTIGCAYQKVIIKSEEGGLFGLSFFDLFQADGLTGILIVGMLKMILVSYIAYAVLGFIEQIIGTMTNAASATSLSSAPSVSPLAAAGATAAPVKKAYQMNKSRKESNKKDKEFAQRRNNARESVKAGQEKQKDSAQGIKKSEGATSSKPEENKGETNKKDQ